MALKEVGTNNLYQSTFMPIFQKAETKIKLIILMSFLSLLSMKSIRTKIEGVIAWVVDNIPLNLKDRNIYIKSLKDRSEQFILLYYKKPSVEYKTVRTLLFDSLKNRDDIKPPKIDNPSDLLNLIADKRNLWKEAKGIPNVMDYELKLKSYIRHFAHQPITTVEKDKKPISLWQKAELDVRYEGQLDMLLKLSKDKVQYAYISSHPDCSKRCEVWQGELVALNERAKNPQTKAKEPADIIKDRFKVGTIDGHTVYSLTDIMEVEDKYGYKNNIICGFNCRHRLIPYQVGSNKRPPTEYTKGEIAQQRAIETRIRELEREIRDLKTQLVMYNKINDPKEANRLEQLVAKKVAYYKNYCNNNGYAYFEYRIKVM